MKNKDIFHRIRRVQGLNALVPLIVIVIFISILRPSFLTGDNIMNVFRQASVYAIMATGMTFVLLTGGVDLSQGSVLALCCVTCALSIGATAVSYTHLDVYKRQIAGHTVVFNSKSSCSRCSEGSSQGVEKRHFSYEKQDNLNNSENDIYFI